MIKTPLSAVIGGAFWTPSATILGSTSKTFNQLIKSIFANGEQGFAYDPNDLTTMFQDSAGTVPVTGAGQAVGLVLDKSKGLILGTQYLSTASFDFTTLEQTVAVTAKTKMSFTTKGAGGCYKLGLASKGTPVKIRLKGTCNIPWVLRNNADLIGSIPVNSGAFDITSYNPAIFQNLGALYFSLTAAGTITLEIIEVTELKGNHAYQATSSMRPLLAATPQRLDYDTVDDKLITNLPAQLTGCTVVRAVPSVGTQILTNQTIPTPYNDNIDNCGLIVINRALTATETSQITRLFNKAAGV